jgi:hypothetical protein
MAPGLIAYARMARAAAPDPVNLKAIALPAEHGGWGLLLEPVVLGLALAPSGAGAAIAVAAVAGFLLHHPAKLLLLDMRRRTVYPRTRVAIRVAGVYLAVALAGLASAWLAGPREALVPLALALPPAAFQLACGAYASGRSLAAELVGALALAATAPAILLAGGSDARTAVLVWAVLAARAAGSIIYIRARLRRDRGLGGSPAPALTVHAAAAAAFCWMAAAGVAGWPLPAAFAVLLARAAWGLSPWHEVVRPRTVGLHELGYGVVSTALFAAAFFTR